MQGVATDMASTYGVLKSPVFWPFLDGLTTRPVPHYTRMSELWTGTAKNQKKTSPNWSFLVLDGLIKDWFEINFT